MGARVALLAAGLLAGLTASASGQLLRAPEEANAQFASLFDPDRFFAGELGDRHDDSELLLSIQASARDDSLPSYALAVAVLVEPGEKPGQSVLAYRARMLSVRLTDDGGDFEDAARIAGNFQHGDAPPETLERARRAGQLHWVEADLWKCAGAVAAFDAVRAADWRPDWHHSRLKPEAQTVIVHPAAVWVTMNGTVGRSSYRGWRMADGVPAEVRKFMGVLEPCWVPAAAAPPWSRERD